MSIINVSDVCKFVNENSFDKVKELCEMNGICVKQNMIDNANNLYLLANTNENKKYNRTSESENQSESENKNESLQKLKVQCNGIIFESSTNNVVCMCQTKIQEISSHSEATELVQSNLNRNIRLEYCEDGTIIRLYNYNNVWYTATTRCIDANNSFWTSKKNFDTMFWEIFDSSLLPTLDKNFTYIFVLLHKENRIVVKHNLNMLVYISRINNKSHHEDYINQFKNVYGIKRSKIIDTTDFLNTREDDYNKFKRGILIKIQDDQTGYWNVYKYDFKMYNLIKSIRGNIPQIRMRYLELLSKPETLDLLEKFYSENYFMFTFIKASLLKLVKLVYKMYVESHIKHTIQIKDDNLYYRTLRQLHAQYKTTNKPITFSDVQTKIYSLDKNIIKKFLSWE